jgi:hypothetical protein
MSIGDPANSQPLIHIITAIDLLKEEDIEYWISPFNQETTSKISRRHMKCMHGNPKVYAASVSRS